VNTILYIYHSIVAFWLNRIASVCAYSLRYFGGWSNHHEREAVYYDAMRDFDKLK